MLASSIRMLNPSLHLPVLNTLAETLTKVSLFYLSLSITHTHSPNLSSHLMTIQVWPSIYIAIVWFLWSCSSDSSLPHSIHSDNHFIYKDNRPDRYEPALTSGDELMFEFDLRGEGVDRTMHVFINGTQVKPFYTHLPPSIRFATTIHNQNDSVEFVSYCIASTPRHMHTEGEKACKYDYN